MSRLFVFPLIFFGSVSAACALEWATQTQQISTGPFQTTADIVFDFKNNSAQPVTIRSLQTNCDCLDASTDQKTYQPGQSGRLTARFTVGDRLGVYQRSITVETDEGPDATSHLSLRIDVPETVAFSQRSVTWRVGGPAMEQTIFLRPMPGLALDFHTAQATNADFVVRLKTVKTGELYRLSVKPKSTKKPANAAIRISGRDNAGHDVLVSGYANVK